MLPTDAAPDAPVEELLRVDHLTIVLDRPDGPAPAVEDVSFGVRRGETLCLVGESGSGKTLTALALVRLLPPAARIAAGRVLFEGRDLLALDDRELRAVRGAGIGLVFQEPASALSPVVTIG
ncbi:MAG TPA: ATP-binding cassette domain-containing protein, partial [Vicinamibacterales bacterium]|nr:ATP-binding cassette domain-containing protein [Vicinamibacterales bacterium]